MRKKKVLIADSDEEFQQTLKENLKPFWKICISGDGKDALCQLESFKPDVLILDLVLPGLDGISLLQKAADKGMHPLVLVTSGFVSDYVLQILESMGVVYIMLKPCSAHDVAARVADMTQSHMSFLHQYWDNADMVSQLLFELGVLTKLLGYQYLRDAIFSLIAKPNQSAMKDLYPYVAAKNGASSSQIERSMRNAIEVAWSKRDDCVWGKYFKPNQAGEICRPTNSRFLFCLADAIRLAENEINISLINKL